jgi:hypothetical protein
VSNIGEGKPESTGFHHILFYFNVFKNISIIGNERKQTEMIGTGAIMTNIIGEMSFSELFLSEKWEVVLSNRFFT